MNDGWTILANRNCGSELLTFDRSTQFLRTDRDRGIMIFDSDSSDSGTPVSCFCDPKEGSRHGVDGASLRRHEKEIIQLASVRNRAVCFRETSNYNRRQRKLANFVSLESEQISVGGTERRNGDWIMCLDHKAEGSVKTYPWTTNPKQKFELVPWRKQKRQLDIINYTAWEPDELRVTDASGQKARKFKQHPPPTAHNQEIRRLIRLRFLFSIELQRQKQMKVLTRNKLTSIEESVVTPRKFANVLTSSQSEREDNNVKDKVVDKESACDINEKEYYKDGKELADSFVGYFGSSGHIRNKVCEDSASGSGKQKHSLGMGRASEEEAKSESVAQVEQHCMSEALSAFNYYDWLVCCDSFKCNECKRYYN